MLIKGQKYPQIGETNRKKYGEDYYQELGRKGGKAKVKKGFAMMHIDVLREVGSKGGKNRHKKDPLYKDNEGNLIV